MNRLASILGLGVLVIATGTADARPKAKPPKPKPGQPAPKPEQAQADRYFKSGVQLFKEAKFSEALAEFMRAYEIAPHPLVLYNIAGCHRELSHYGEAVSYYERFLAEGKGQVPAARLTAAQTELDGILARIARVTVTVTPDGASLTVDGDAIGTLVQMPLILSPGEHKLVATAPGRKEVERSVRVASGDELTVELSLEALPTEKVDSARLIEHPVVLATKPKRFALGAAFGTNLLRAGDSGAPTLGLGVAIGSRLELGVDAVLVAYAVIPQVRVRLAGDAFSIHVVAAAPIAITDDGMTKTFVAGAGGLGLRYRATPMLSFQLESLVSYAGKTHGTTVPTFLGGQLWF
ncbi:MAG: PEGA domain-containing protein [Myxococcales bacterium]|nr:PEGA domain-containing protein [Myxococcales bacterium]